MLLASTLAASTLAAQDTGWIIERMVIRLDIQADGTLRANEEIDVDFQSLERRGIFRDIDIRFEHREGRIRLYDIELQSVTDAAGNTQQVLATTEGATRRFRIGNPDRTVSGKQGYRIGYHVAGSLNGFADHDELYWNATGVWPVPLHSTRVVVTGPAASITRVDCFQGARGSTERCNATFTPDEATFTATRILQPGEQMTVVAALRKGAVPDPQPILIAGRSANNNSVEIQPRYVVLSIVMFFGAIAGIFMLWRREGRDRRYRAQYHGGDPGGDEEYVPMGAKPIAVEFEPPGKIRPGQIGLLIDERVDTLDITATIIDLASRGFLSITEIPKKGWLGKTDWQLTKNSGNESKLLRYERIVYDGLFESRSEVKISDLKDNYHTELTKAREALYANGVEQKWFPRSPESVRGLWLALGLLAIGAGIALAFVLNAASGQMILGAPIVVAGIVLAAMSGAMPRRTALGHQLFMRSLGFAKYMRTAEKHPQAFAERMNIFTEYLPYAIVFKCVDKWAKAFEDIDLATATASWYTGTTAFNPSAFASGMNGFSDSVSGAIASTPGSSGGSGFGGGGSSGGGGGGGGGGSW